MRFKWFSCIDRTIKERLSRNDVDREPRQAIGGQAYWSFGGLFLVNSKIQQRLGVKDSYELALNDWLGSAEFDRQMMRTIGRNNGLKRTCDLPLLKRKTI